MSDWRQGDATYNQKSLARRRLRYATDPVYRDRKRANAKRSRLNNPAARDRLEMLKYGITLEQRDAMLADQGGCCAICKTTEPGRGKAWNVDHCHATGQVRGLLCVRCNFVGGHAKDKVDVLVNAAVYL
mgnify:CR=1 FL=1